MESNADLSKPSSSAILFSCQIVPVPRISMLLTGNPNAIEEQNFKMAANSLLSAKSSQSPETVLKGSLAGRPSLFETGEQHGSKHNTLTRGLELESCSI